MTNRRSPTIARRRGDVPLRLRVARRADLAQLVELQRQAMATERGFSPDLVARRFVGRTARRCFARDLRARSARWWVALHAGRVVGMLGADLRIAKGVYAPVRRHVLLHSMYVEPNARRARAGWRLIRTALRWASRQRATQVRLETAYGNSGAQRLYERVGFARREIFYTLTLRPR